MNPIQQGLYVSVVGLAVLFATSAIFYLVLVGLQKLFPARKAVKESVVEETAAPAAKAADEKAIVAAIAVALSMNQSQAIPGLGESLQSNRSAWWSSRLMAAHKKTSISRS